MSTLFDIPLQRIDGTPTTLADHEGSVMLIVNVASKCGLTPQYSALEELYQSYRERDLVVLGFPCNDFAGQEPGSEAEIQQFCSTTFDVSFPLFAKVNINSSPRHPLYAALIQAMPEMQDVTGGGFRDKLKGYGFEAKQPSDVLWNFEKFLIGRNGQVIGRFAPDTPPDHPALVQAIEEALDTGSGLATLQ